MDNFTDIDLWVPKSVVGPDRRIKQWFIEQKEKELKYFKIKKEQSDLDQFSSFFFYSVFSKVFLTNWTFTISIHPFLQMVLME